LYVLFCGADHPYAQTELLERGLHYFPAVPLTNRGRDDLMSLTRKIFAEFQQHLMGTTCDGVATVLRQSYPFSKPRFLFELKDFVKRIGLLVLIGESQLQLLRRHVRRQKIPDNAIPH